jgi:hypothetical protein
MNDNRTPRAWLLSRHDNVGPQLDALRRDAVAALSGVSRGEAALPVDSWRDIVRAIFLPQRSLWRAFAVVWLGLVVFHFTLGGSNPPPSSTRIPPATLAVWLSQIKSHEIFAPIDRIH